VIGLDDMTQCLEREGARYQVLSHRHTETAWAEAAALGLTPGQVAKTIVLSMGSGFVRAVLPASERLDLRKVRELLALSHEPRLATEAELAASYPTFEVGAVPPLGGPPGDRTVVDRHLLSRHTVVLEAGSHDESVRVKTRDLLWLTQAEVGDICCD
jgi:Ala-tRNA(Pro) deacylase